MTDKSSVIGESYEPRNLIEQVAAHAMTCAGEEAEKHGGKLRRIMVMIEVDGLGERDTVVAGEGYQDGRDLFAVLITEAISVGRQLGVDVKLLNALGKGVGRG
jgi:hypothetical protein